MNCSIDSLFIMLGLARVKERGLQITIRTCFMKTVDDVENLMIMLLGNSQNENM